MSNRAAATAFILENISQIDVTDTDNRELTKNQLESLSDTQFETFMKRISRVDQSDPDREQDCLTYYAPNLGKTKITIAGNLALAKKLGHAFFERLWLTDPQTGVTYLTPNQYMVIDLPIRRQAQLLIKKASIPLDHKSVDELSGQVTGASKGSKLSFPELQSQASQALDQTIIEEIKIRGGDEQAYREFERQMMEKGSCSQSEILQLGTNVKSTETLSILLKGMHLDNNLADKIVVREAPDNPR
jgi:hypothetical protein